MEEIIYNKEKNSLELKDNLRKYYLVVGFVMLLSIFNVGIYFINFSLENREWGWVELFFVLIGLVMLYGFYYINLKKSFVNQVSIENISHIELTTRMGRKFSIRLKNGKTRDLPMIKSMESEKQLQRLCSKLKIKVVEKNG